MAAAVQEPPHTGSGGEEIPRYPPFLKGLPLPPLALLMATQSGLIARLRRELALGEDEDGADRWETFVQPVIARYAAFVHLIPASETHHHRGAGGLYRHGLEAAFHAARASRGVMVGLDRPRTEQRRLEPRLRVAAALGGLLHDAGKAIHDVSATDRAGRWTWSPIDADLGEWAAEHGIQRYFLHWREQRAHGGHAVFNVIALKRILPTRVERWLSEPDPGLYTGLVAAITGMAHSSALVELVRNADRHSVERDLREHRIESIDTAVGVPVDRYLVDAMRRLIHDGRWQVNVPGARVWLLRDAGLHLVWPAAARDITELLTTDRVPGIPRDPDTIAELLLERGLAVPRVDALGRHSTWRLAPALLAREGGKPVSLTMLRLNDLGLLFPSGGPTAVAVMSSADAVGQSLPLPVAAGSQPQRSDANADADLAHGATSMAPSIGDAASVSAPDPASSGDVASRTDAGADVINGDCPSDHAEATDAASDTQQDADDRTALNEARTWLLALSDSSERLLAAFGDQPATAY